MVTEETINEVKNVLDSLDIYCVDCKWNGNLDTEDCVEGEEGYNRCEDCHRKQMNFKPDTDKIINRRYGN